MTTKTDFAKYLSIFLSEYMPHERNVSKNTLVAYRDSFVGFIGYMNDRKKIPVERLQLEHLTRENVIGYLRWMVKEKNVTPQTRNYKLAAIRSFCNYLQYKLIDRLAQWQDIRSIPLLKTENKAIEYLTPEGIKLLLAQTNQLTAKGRRHLALLSLMYDTAARVQEVADLTMGSLRIEAEPYTIKIIGKGRKARIIPLSREQVELLRSYIEENSTTLSTYSSPLFQNSRGTKLTREGIAYILKRYARMARKNSSALIPERPSPHSLRHSRAMHLLRDGIIHIVDLRDILGHESIQTTSIYVRADSKSKREALERAYQGTTPKPPTDRQWERDKDLLDWLKQFGY
jgi:site-specific recombinase XerD